MTTTLSPLPKVQFFDDDGNPLSGGKLYTYRAGTTTPFTTFTDYFGTTPNTNPVILDSRGEANVWCSTGLYKFMLTDANDNEIWTVDYISGGGSGSTESSSLGYVNVKDPQFGAVGDGINDDTPAIQSAIAVAEAAGGIVWLPPGIYRITSNLVFTWPNTTGPDSIVRCGLQGAGAGLTFIYDYRADASDRGAITFDFSSYNPEQLDARNFYSRIGGFSLIKQTNATTLSFNAITGAATYSMGQGVGIWIEDMPALTGEFKEVRIIGYEVGLKAIGLIGAGIENFNIQLCDTAFDVLDGRFWSSNLLTFKRCSAAAARTFGFRINQGGAIKFIAGNCTGCGDHGNPNSAAIYFETDDIQMTGIDVDGMYFENNRGVADVFIRTETGDNSETANAVRNCLFARNYASFYTTHNVAWQVFGTLKGTLTVQDCGFRGFNTYVPNASRKYINVSGATSNLDTAYINNMYSSSVEAPTTSTAATTFSSISFGGGQAVIASTGVDNLVICDTVAVGPTVGIAPLVTNTYFSGGSLLRWAGVFTRDLDVSNQIQWGFYTIPVPPGGTTQFLRADGTWSIPAGTGVSLSGANTWTAVNRFQAGIALGTGAAAITANVDQVVLNNLVFVDSVVGIGPALNNTYSNGGSSLRWSGTWTTNLNVNGTFTWGSFNIAVPPGGTTQFLRADGTWSAPPGTGTVTSVALNSGNAAISVTGSPITTSGTLTVTANAFTASAPGVVPASGGGTTNYLRADGTWSAPITFSGTTPTAVSSAAGSPGTASTVARSDHSHQINLSGTYAWTNTHSFAAATTFTAQQLINYGVTASAANAQIRNASNNLYFSSQNAFIGIVDAGGGVLTLVPGTNNTHDLGFSGFRWKEVWAVNGVINTSDARLKTDIRPFTINELRAASRIAQHVGFYQWKSEVGRTDIERCGLTVQRVMSILEEEGLDPMAYDFIRHDTASIAGEEVTDVYSFIETHLLMFIARGQEHRLRTLEERLGALVGD